MPPDKREVIQAELREVYGRMGCVEVPEGLSDEELVAWLQQTKNDLQKRHEALQAEAIARSCSIGRHPST